MRIKMINTQGLQAGNGTGRNLYSINLTFIPALRKDRKPKELLLVFL